MKTIQLGVGAYGIGAWVENGQASLIIQKAKVAGKVAGEARDRSHFHKKGVVIHLGNRKAAKVLLRRLKLAIALLPK